MRTKRTYSVFLLIKHKGSNGPTLIGVGPGLSTDVDSSTANAEVVGGAGDSVERRRYCKEVVMEVGDNRSG